MSVSRSCPEVSRWSRQVGSSVPIIQGLINLDFFICKVGVQGAGWISVSFIECLLSEVMGEKMQDWGSQRAKLCLKSKE